MIFSVPKDEFDVYNNIKGNNAELIKVNKLPENIIDKARIAGNINYLDNNGAIITVGANTKFIYTDKIDIAVIGHELKFKVVDLNEFEIDDLLSTTWNVGVGTFTTDTLIVGDWFDRYSESNMFRVTVKNELVTDGVSDISKLSLVDCTLDCEMSVCSRDMGSIITCEGIMYNCILNGGVVLENNLMSNCKRIDVMFSSCKGNISLRGTDFSGVKSIERMFSRVTARRVDLSDVDFSGLEVIRQFIYDCEVSELDLSGIKLRTSVLVGPGLVNGVGKIILDKTDLRDFDINAVWLDKAWTGAEFWNREQVGIIQMFDCLIGDELLDKFHKTILCSHIITNMDNVDKWCRRNGVKCAYEESNK